MQILHVCIQLLPGKNPESRNKAISANPHDLFLSLRDIRFWSRAPVSRAVTGMSEVRLVFPGESGLLSVMIILRNRDMSNS